MLSVKNKKYIFGYLSIIGFVSLLLKLFFSDFSLPFHSDNLLFMLNAISYGNGDYTASANKSPGWSLFLGLFYTFLNSERWIDYSIVSRILSIVISTITIFPMYFLARKFFDEKYSIISASMFAFIPYLNFNAGLGMSEPLYLFIFVSMICFLLYEKKFRFLPFLLTGLLFWVRFQGITIFIALSMIYFLSFKQRSNITTYFIGLILFLVIISPILTQRYEQYGDPLYMEINQIFFVDDRAMFYAENLPKSSMFDYIAKNGYENFFQKFIFTGTLNLLDGFVKMSFPYLIFLFPIGMYYSIRNQTLYEKKFRPIWIFILTILGTMIMVFAVQEERRFLFSVFPLLIIFATMGLQKIISLNILKKIINSTQKKNFLIITIIILLIITSGIFSLRFEKLNPLHESEKIEFAKFLLTLDGKILDSGNNMDYFDYAIIDNSNGKFKTYTISSGILPEFSFGDVSLLPINIYGKTLDELISIGKQHDLKYLVISEDDSIFYEFLDDIYFNEEKYPFLTKIFDSNEQQFKSFKTKVFQINYEKYQ